MADNIGIEISKGLQKILSEYQADILENFDSACDSAMQSLVSETKATAPVGKSKKHFKNYIDYKNTYKDAWATTYTWYVKAPAYRLTHLLVNGHQTRNGGRTKANPFLQNALDNVLPKVESDLKKIIEGGK